MRSCLVLAHGLLSWVLIAGSSTLLAGFRRSMPPNNAFKPKLHRYAVNMAGRACHVAGYALQFGLT
jgi:hypothetical protein